ncbi:MAG: matrixin family metalloprotease [Deltaproteobacteria bacterium]|nr:matrixin family metalloprotease [Deltaproteobacteria bacterium]
MKKTSRGELVHWEERSVSYTLDPSLDRNVADAVLATRDAMRDWSGTVGAPNLVGKAPTSDSPKKPGFDSKNGVFFMKDGWAPAGRALAITVLTYDNSTGAILDADIIFNGTYKFAVLAEHHAAAPSPTVGGTRISNTDGITHVETDTGEPDAIYDLHHVVAHELGHSLGMNDEMARRDALMYRYSAPNDTTMRSPASDDIAGLAELYSTKIEAGGNGCGNATVAPKKPGVAASQLAMFATLGLLLFLVLRGRSDRRARFAFVAAAALATYGLLPTVSKPSGGVASAHELAPGHARAQVTSTSTSVEAGLFKTTYALATTVCRAATCPKIGHGSVWGGVSGNIRQEVGGQFAPQPGDAVDVSFGALPSALAPLSSPLGPRSGAADGEVKVLTAAD